MRIFSQKQQQALKPSTDKVRQAGKERPEGDESTLTRGEDSLLFLQQTVGNQALQRILQDRGLIQRDEGNGADIKEAEGTSPERGSPQPEGKKEGSQKENEGEAAKPPAWFLVSSNEPIEGDPVPNFTPVGGLPGNEGPYTDQDCQFLQDQLLLRNLENEKNIRNFETNYRAVFLSLWTRFVTSEMIHTYEFSGAAYLGIFGFLIRSSYLKLFNKALGTYKYMDEEEKMLTKIFFDKPHAGVLEMKQWAYEEEEASNEEEEKGEQLEKLGDRLSELMGETLTGAFSPLNKAIFYTEWLGNAPLEELGRFRLPSLVADIPLGEIETSIAQAIAGFAYQEPANDYEYFHSNSIRLTLLGTEPGKETVLMSPTFYGSKVLAQKLVGQPVASMPSVAITFTLGSFASETTEIPDLISKTPGGAALSGQIAAIAEAWPEKSDMKVSRDPKGSTFITGGRLSDWLHVFQRANPGVDPYSFLAESAARLVKPVPLDYLNPEDAPPENTDTPEEEVQALRDSMAVGISYGADRIIQETINPLPVGYGNGPIESPSQTGGTQGSSGGQQGGQTEGTAETSKGSQVKTPKWFRTSSAEPIEGEPVPGFTDRQGPFTEKDRQALQQLLNLRTMENARNGSVFVGRYSSMFSKIWTGYVTKEMEKAIEEAGWSFWSKFLGLVVRASLMVVFEAYALEEMAEVAVEVAEALEQTADLSLELTQSALERRSTGSGIEKRAGELENLVMALSANVSLALEKAITSITEGKYYAEWLGDADLGELYRFRLPRRFPEVKESDIAVSIAESISSNLHEDTYAYEGEDNNIFMTLDASVPGELKAKDGPYFRGSKALGKHLVGQSLELMPDIPILVNLVGDLYEFDSTLNVSSPEQLAAVKILSNAWELKSPLSIERNKNGEITAFGGNLAENLYLYHVAHPEVDLFSLLSEFTPGMDLPQSPTYSSEMAANGVFGRLNPSMQEGAKKFFKEMVLKLKLSQAREGK